MSTTERRLAAILAADVVGYSRMMSTDEDGTLERLKGHFSELIRPKVIEHRGRIVKTTGDGVLAEFNSVYDAFACALQIQEGMAARNRGETDKRMDLRIGINIGDIIFDEDDIFGDGVNIAARLEGLAQPGGICVSARAWEDLRKLDVAFVDLGDQQLKNIAAPVRAYGVALEGHVPGRPVPAKARRRNWLVFVLVGVAIAAALWLLFGMLEQPKSPRSFVQAAIDGIPCSWLRIAEADESASFDIAGASFTPSDVIAQEILRSAVKDHIDVKRISASKVAPLLQAQCPWIGKVRSRRYRGVPRMTTQAIRYRSAGPDSIYTPGTRIGEVVLSLNLNDFQPEVSLFGIKPDGRVEFLTSKRKLVAAHKVQDDGRVELPLEFNHSGWSGIMLMESATPIPNDSIKKTVLSASDLAAFDRLARDGKWRFELDWFHTDLGRGGNPEA